MMRNRVFVAAVFLALAGAAFAAAQEPAAQRAAGVKAILVGDTNQFANGDAAADVDGMKRYVSGLPGFDAERDLRVLEGDDVTAANILQTVDDLDVQPTETLLFYYEGHGAYDPNEATDGDPSGGHLIQIMSGDLLRADLMDHLKAKGAQLTVLITETCNVQATYMPQGHPQDHALGEAIPDVVVSASLERLLYNYTGVVDVNASQRGESSWSSQDGGFFTQSLLRTLDDDDQFRDPPADLPRLKGDFNENLWKATENWRMFLDRVSEKTHTIFLQHQDAERMGPEPVSKGEQVVRQELLNQKDERPEVFQLDVQPVGQPALDSYFVPPAPNDFLTPPPVR